jgi:hypothetical protein
MKRLAFIIPFLAVALAGCDDDPPTTPPPSPTAAFTVAGTQQAGQAVRFNASGSADPGGGGLSYSWSFGDGAHGGTREIAHLFAQGGAYAVQLTVRDAAGATASTTQTVTIAPGPAATGTVTVKGRVTLPDGTPLAGVAVTVAGSTAGAQTDAQGAVTLAGVPAGVPLVLRLVRAGHAEGSVRLAALANGSADGWFQSALAPRGAAGTLASAQAGGPVVGPSGARVVFPPAALVRADGSPATGAVDVAITPVDVVNAIGAFPGPFTGIQADGTSTPIATFGVMEIDVSQGGQPLQVAPGLTATLDIPIYTGGAAAGQTIPLWSLDEVAGMWVQEGTGTVVASAASPTGLVLRATVSHLSWWNVDVPYVPFVAIVRCVTMTGGNPVPLTVSCWVHGAQQGAGAPVAAATTVIPPGGQFALPLFANVPIQLTGSTLNGTLAGSVMVTGAPGTVQNVDIVLNGTITGPSQALVVAVGGDQLGTLAVFDGTAWFSLASPFGAGNGRGQAIGAGNGRWVVGGSGPGAVLASSTDRLNWTAAPSSAAIFTSVSGVAWNLSGWVAVGDGPNGFTAAHSSDGLTWTAVPLPPGLGVARAVAPHPTYWLAGGTSGSFLASTDGTTWTASASPFGSGELRALKWNGNRWVAVGDGPGGPLIATSTDGSTWSTQPSPVNGVRAVGWNGYLWVIAGDGAVATSLDAVTWTPHVVPAARVFGLAWLGTEWMAAAEASGGGALVLTSSSPSAITWTAAPLPFANAGRAILSAYWPN